MDLTWPSLNLDSNMLYVSILTTPRRRRPSPFGHHLDQNQTPIVSAWDETRLSLFQSLGPDNEDFFTFYHHGLDWDVWKLPFTPSHNPFRTDRYAYPSIHSDSMVLDVNVWPDPGQTPLRCHWIYWRGSWTERLTTECSQCTELLSPNFVNLNSHWLIYMNLHTLTHPQRQRNVSPADVGRSGSQSCW